METVRKRSSGISSNGLRTWGMFFLLAGMLGKSILQNGLLNLGAVSFGQLLEQMQTSRAAMLYATLALLLQAMETCAVPIFAFLLVEGVEHTSSLRNYALRVAGLAVLSELPYNLATSGKLLDTTSRNPVFGLVVCLVMVYLYQKFPEKNAPHLLLRVLVTVQQSSGVPCCPSGMETARWSFSPRCGRSGAKAPSRALWARQCPSCAASSRCSSWLRRWAFWPFTFTTVKKARKTASSIIWRIRHCCWSSAQQGGFCSEPVPRFQS